MNHHPGQPCSISFSENEEEGKKQVANNTSRKKCIFSQFHNNILFQFLLYFFSLPEQVAVEVAVYPIGKGIRGGNRLLLISFFSLFFSSFSPLFLNKKLWL